MPNKTQPPAYTRRPSKRRFYEGLIQWMFRLATYIVILAAGYIFANIAINGSKAVFTTEAPFINITFLTQKPQTLHVYEPKAVYEEMESINRERLSLRRDLRDLGKSDPEQKIILKVQIAALDENYD